MPMIKKHHIIFGLLALVLIIALVVLYLPHTLFAPAREAEQSAAITSETAQYAAPVNLEAYIKAEDEYTSSGGINPADSWQFETKTVAVPEGSTTAAYAAEVAANQIGLGGGPARAEVTHFSIVNGTAYILLNIDQDGWTGVSFAQSKVHPIVVHTLRLYPGIGNVVFGLPPH